MTDPLARAWRGLVGRAHELAVLQYGLSYDDLLQEARLAVWLTVPPTAAWSTRSRAAA